MRKSMKAIAAASTLVAALAVAPDILAQDQPATGGSGSAQTPGGMMGQGGMMGMMGMMNQMNQMMEGCTKMMQSMSERPSRGQGNQPQQPAQPERRG